MILLWFLLSLTCVALACGLVFSFLFTRRHTPDETRSPAEYSLDFETVSFPARDGLTLRGWWIPAAGSDRAVIFLHGHGGSMDPDVQYAPAFRAAGLSVLMFDFRAHGRSEGQVSTLGYLERQDVLGAVDFVKAKGIERLGLMGFSMGGVVAMLTAPICPHVRAVISDGGPARWVAALTGWGMEHSLPRWLSAMVAWLTLAVTSLRLRANMFRDEPVKWVGQIAPRPIFFIHGERDPYLPPNDFEALTAAANPPKEIWRVPEAGHRTVDQVYPDEYRYRVVAFFERNL